VTVTGRVKKHLLHFIDNKAFAKAATHMLDCYVPTPLRHFLRKTRACGTNIMIAKYLDAVRGE
jgi:hypothetical protein